MSVKQRAATTIVLITRQDLVRADFGSGTRPEVLNLVVQPRPDLPDVGALVDAALALAPKPGRNVWVLSADVWTQTLPLPTVRTASLSADELANALNFEAEGLSGQAAFESTVGFAPQVGNATESVYWIAQVRIADLQLIEEAVVKAGNRVAGICHPGGVPLPVTLRSKINTSWLRAELWPDAVVCVEGAAHGPVSVRVINSAPQLGQWRTEWEQRRASHSGSSHQELLVDVGVAPPAGMTVQGVVQLDDETALRDWLMAWAIALAAKVPAVPFVRPARRPMSIGQRRALTIGLALLVAVLCAAHYFWLDRTLQATQAELQTAREPARKLAELQKRAKDLESKRNQVKMQHEKLVQQIGQLQFQRQRLPRLLASLAEHGTEELLVQTIESSAGEPQIHGVCLYPEMADHYASKLAKCLPEFGWSAEPPKKEGKNYVKGGGPWQFEIQFHALGLPTAEPRLTSGKAALKASP
jgi:hypothetical protein